MVQWHLGTKVDKNNVILYAELFRKTAEETHNSEWSYQEERHRVRCAEFWFGNLIHPVDNSISPGSVHLYPNSKPSCRGNSYKCFLFFFLVKPHLWHEESWFPNQGSNLCPLHWKHGVLTTGPPGKSQKFISEIEILVLQEDRYYTVAST